MPGPLQGLVVHWPYPLTILTLQLHCCMQDKRITFEAWGSGELKAKVPFGQIPVLHVDGKRLVQSAAIGECG